MRHLSDMPLMSYKGRKSSVAQTGLFKTRAFDVIMCSLNSVIPPPLLKEESLKLVINITMKVTAAKSMTYITLNVSMDVVNAS